MKDQYEELIRRMEEIQQQRRPKWKAPFDEEFIYTHIGFDFGTPVHPGPAPEPEPRRRELPPMFRRQLQEFVKAKTGINFCEKPEEPAAFIRDADGTLFMHNTVRDAPWRPPSTWAKIGRAMGSP